MTGVQTCALPIFAGERGELAQPIVAGCPDLLAEVSLAARREQARSIGDVLLRRTRLGLLAARELTEPDGDTQGGRAPVEIVGDVLARELGWDAQRLALELERFEREADQEGIAVPEGVPAEARAVADSGAA